MNKERIAYLDWIRVVACLMVIIMHAPKPEIGTSSYVLLASSLLTMPCIGLFFMVSGALLLPVKEDMKSFYKKRLSKVVFPTITWSIVYLLVGLAYHEFSVIDFFRSLVSIPFSAQGHGIMWFMYTMIALYFLAPVISPWLERASKKELQFVLLLWCVSLLYPYLNYVVEINDSKTGLLYYFSGFAGYFILGYYLHRYPSRLNIASLIAIWSFPIICAVCLKVGQINVDYYSIFYHHGLLVAMMVFSIYCLLQKVKKTYRWIAFLSDQTFGIYLCHILIMRRLLWRVQLFDMMGGIPQIIITAILTFVLSLSLTVLLKRIPFGRYLI